MDNNYNNFKSWYADVLSSLYGNRDAGLVVFMISLPLSERYIRQRAGLCPDADLNDACMQHFRSIFPVLPDVQTVRQFWNVFRNGFLHQATLSRITRRGTALPAGSLTHDISEPVQVESDGSFCVHPVLFSQRIISEIECNFAMFVGASTTSPPLPTTVMYVGAPNGLAVPPIIISTKGGY